ncbi:replication initiation factor domain-containing protein, partial [Paenibacillus larvae]
GKENEDRKMSEANLLPPPTNRGVPNTKKKNNAEEVPNTEKLTACIDWCQITVKNENPATIADKILGIPYDLMRTDLRGGIKGYRSLMCLDDIRVLEPGGGNEKNGYQILMAGKGCREFEKFLVAQGIDWYDFFERTLQYEVNFPRVDLAIDDRKTYFKISTLLKMADNGLCISRHRIGKNHGTFYLSNGSTGGKTIDFGSRSSELFLTFYEKGYEQASKYGIEEDKIDKNWNRYELKFRQKRAVNLVRELVQRREVFMVAMEVLNETLRFVTKGKGENRSRWPTWQPWKWFMRDIGKLNLRMMPKEKTFPELYHWLSVYVAPSLRVIREVDQSLGTNNLETMIEGAKLENKHHFLIQKFIDQANMEELEREQLLLDLERVNESRHCEAVR